MNNNEGKGTLNMYFVFRDINKPNRTTFKKNKFNGLIDYNCDKF